MGLEYKIINSTFEENLSKTDYINPSKYCLATARKKGEMVLKELLTKDDRPDLLVSADTIVVCDGIILEKPIDLPDAKRMLQMISDKTLEVITAVSIFMPQSMLRADDAAAHPEHSDDEYVHTEFSETTKVFMMELDDALIEGYLSSGEGMDNAGALVYQGAAFMLVRGIEGCYYSLIGFPAALFNQKMASLLK